MLIYATHITIKAYLLPAMVMVKIAGTIGKTACRLPITSDILSEPTLVHAQSAAVDSSYPAWDCGPMQTMDQYEAKFLTEQEQSVMIRVACKI